MTPRAVIISAVIAVSVLSPVIAQEAELTETAKLMKKDRNISDGISAFPKRRFSDWLPTHLQQFATSNRSENEFSASPEPHRAVGLIVTLKRSGGTWAPPSSASCFAIRSSNDSDFIVTCGHVLPSLGKNDVFLIGVKNHAGDIKLVKRCILFDKESDIAVFEIDKLFSAAVELAHDHQSLSLGSKTVIWGRHSKFGFLRLQGDIIGRMKAEVLLSDAKVVSGLSGSPCFDSRGRVFGLVQEVLPSLRQTQLTQGDHFSEGTYTAIRLLTHPGKPR